MENVSESDDVRTSIIHLPDDCLSFIFQRLDNLEDHDSFGLTCHRFLNIQNINRRSLQFQCSLSLLNSPTLSQTTLAVNSDHLHRLLTRFQWLEHLSLSGCTVLNDSSLASLRYPGAKLHSLHLDCCYGVSDDGISTVASFCPNLRVVSLYRCGISDIGLETLARAASLALRCVNLSYCPLVSDFGVKALTQACVQLESVKISNCKSITGVGFINSSPTLGYVDAESCQLEPKGVAGIISGGGVEFLNISGPVSYIGKDGLVPIGSGVASKLRVLNIRMCRTVGDESIKAIAKGCPLLQEWNLALCHEVRVEGWEAVGKWCCSLKRLHVNRCRNLCDQGLLGIRRGCKNLRILHMNGNARLTTTAIEMFKLHRGDVTLRSEEVMVIGPDWGLYTRG
ncbi:F-box/LRR-repeat protein 12 [Brassica napus]|uniref:F-box/LRR-repeat protein 12 n=1 Tax=Brassica napus TaxID=3708 RepID=UPI002078B88C|nr:F-box/LRR-repeat protein 12 [Brassica napus]XP_013750583.2 F-box/LRR-repeat protein 12 [Brassica napus]XP_048636016.1 F-box/LRR-repeat protein 12 [Brassica napus]